MKTVDRSRLWQAQTPQLFRLGMLRDALQLALADELPITDEASVIEHAGFHPRLVMGDRTNIKITEPRDLELAERILTVSPS